MERQRFDSAQNSDPLDFTLAFHKCLEAEDREMSLGTILLIILLLMLIGVIPTWPHSRSWGYGPSGMVGLILVVLVILLLLGMI